MSEISPLVGDQKITTTTTPTTDGSIQRKAVVPITMKLRLFLYVVAFVHCMGAFGFGYNTAIVSPAKQPITDEFILDTMQQSVMVSSILVTSLIGALVAGSLSDIFGRHIMLLVDDVLFATGIIVETIAPLYWVLLIGRLTVGLGVGIASVVVPLMVTEIAPKNIRGEIGVLNQLGITIGIEISYIVGTAFANVKGDWRWMLGLAGIFCVVHFVGALILRVETPRWLTLKGKHNETKKMLQKLRLTDDVDSELEEIETAAKMELTQKTDVISALKSLKWRVLVVSLGLSFFQQITGINAIMYYMSTFFIMAGMSESSSNMVSILVGAINVGMTIVSVFLLDRLGRKPLLLTGLGTMILSLLAISIGFFFFDDSTSKTVLGVISVAGTITFVMGFAISLGAVTCITISEVCPNNARGLVMSMSLATSWITNLAVSLSFLNIIDATSESVVFFGFCVFSMLGFLFVFLLVPETKGKSPQEIAYIMAGGSKGKHKKKKHHRHHHHHHHHKRQTDKYDKLEEGSNSSEST